MDKFMEYAVTGQDSGGSGSQYFDQSAITTNNTKVNLNQPSDILNLKETYRTFIGRSSQLR